MKKIWVVELLENEKWGPTDSALLIRETARRVKRNWEKSYPDDKLRVQKYISTDDIPTMIYDGRIR